MAASSWHPLLEGDLAAWALEAVRALAAGLIHAPAWTPGPLSAETETGWRASLASGDAGRALFYAYLSLHGARTGEPAGSGLPDDPADLALELLDRATDGMAAAPMSESLYNGFPGIAWVAEHLEGKIFEADEDANREIDEALLRLLARSPWPGEVDLLNGLVGIGVYALERLPHPGGASCLARVIERLAERAERTGEGIAWFSPPEILPWFQRESYPRGLYNLGVSHGTAGIIALLGAVCRAGVEAVAARRLLDGAMAWLLARKLGPESPFRFPHFHHPDTVPRTCRLAWCYGDAGMAATLLFAARETGEPAWEREALDVALTAASRTPESSGVRDAGLCHGAAGLGHLFHRMYQATGEERLARAAVSWYERALSFRKPGSGPGGFRSWSADLQGTAGWRDDPGLLEGAAGVGLALLAAVSPVDPAWDRLLLVAPFPDPQEYTDP